MFAGNVYRNDASENLLRKSGLRVCMYVCMYVRRHVYNRVVYITVKSYVYAQGAIFDCVRQNFICV